ncbi:hypothetical protein [Gracilibacillus sp. YIM 98692]|uniref:hypothetical protein n=1 Tax=Gracilibacillus sp. YIM 98692 TaxID=2663532 RepID=UPI0013D4F237|nr:hypothetical protein [Gracilibacillus sp. YIM 98692]
MYICTICNGLERLEATCKNCEAPLEDAGKVVDYYGDYSPYIEANDAQLIDGVSDSSKQHQCIHVGTCSTCQMSQEIVVQEQKI